MLIIIGFKVNFYLKYRQSKLIMILTIEPCLNKYRRNPSVSLLHNIAPSESWGQLVFKGVRNKSYFVLILFKRYFEPFLTNSPSTSFSISK